MSEALDRPRCEATITESGEVQVSVGGIQSKHENLDAALIHLGATAASLRRPIKLTAHDEAAPDDPQYLIVDESGAVTTNAAPPQGPKRRRRTRRASDPHNADTGSTLATDLLGSEGASAPQDEAPDQRQEEPPAPEPVAAPEAAPEAEAEPEAAPEPEPEAAPEPEPEAAPEPEPVAAPVAAPEPEPVAAPVAVAAPEPEAGRSPQFVAPSQRVHENPAQEGWQGWLNRALGTHLPPSPQEQAHRANLAALQRQWVGPRTIAVLNSKGGAGKTPTTIRLAAEVARAGGGGVLAWDNNESLGTLGWRIEQGEHTNTVVDFIEAAPKFLSENARRADLTEFVHHQGQDMFDALISDDDPAHQHLITGQEVDLLHEVASRNWRLIVMDSGNATRGEHFERMIHHADQIVLVTTRITDMCQGAVDSWRALASRGGHAEELARNAVLIVTETNLRGIPPEKLHTIEEIREKFAGYIREVRVVPFDSALVAGVMRSDDLRPATRHDWQAAAAAVIEQF